MSVRLRLAAAEQAADVIAPLVCELTDEAVRDAIVAGLGPDPLRDDADTDAALGAIRASGQAIGALLLDQSVIAGIGNVLRAELLNMTGIHPAIEGRCLDLTQLDDLWRTSVTVMRQAEREGRIITRRPASTAVETVDEVEGRFVYGREHCGRCLLPAGSTDKDEQPNHRGAHREDQRCHRHGAALPQTPALHARSRAIPVISPRSTEPAPLARMVAAGCACRWENPHGGLPQVG